MNELQAFEKHLRENEKSPATIEKYLCDACAFLCWLDGREPTKELTVCYKEGLKSSVMPHLCTRRKPWRSLRYSSTAWEMTYCMSKAL